MSVRGWKWIFSKTQYGGMNTFHYCDVCDLKKKRISWQAKRLLACQENFLKIITILNIDDILVLLSIVLVLHVSA